MSIEEAVALICAKVSGVPTIAQRATVPLQDTAVLSPELQMIASMFTAGWSDRVQNEIEIEVAALYGAQDDLIT